MSTADNRRPRHPHPPRREPLFPLEAEDIAPRIRRGPPAPLGDLLGDLNAAMPTKADGLRREVVRPPPSAAPQAEARRAPPIKTQSRPSVRPQTRPQPRPMAVAGAADDLRAAQVRHAESEADLHQARLLTARPHLSYRPLRVLPPPSLNRWLMLGVVALASLLVLAGVRGPGGSILSRWGGDLLGTIRAERMTDASKPQLFGAAHLAGDYTLKGAPSLSAQQIDAILAAYGSPAAGTGAVWHDLGVKYGIDPAFAVAFFIHESSAGTNADWAGIKADGGTTHNVGNIICAGSATCYGRFRDYGSWGEGIDDWYRLIDTEYIQGRGTLTVQDIIPIYAPSFENDVQAYINSVTDMVDGWRSNGVH